MIRVVIEFRGATAVVKSAGRTFTLVRLGEGWVTASGDHIFETLEHALRAMSDVVVSS